MHYLNEGNAHVDMVEYDICILSLEYCIVLLDEIKLDEVDKIK